MGRCSSFREAAEVVGRQAFPMFLNVTANVTNWNGDGTECSLVRGETRRAMALYVGQLQLAGCGAALELRSSWQAHLQANALLVSRQVLSGNPLADFVELPEENNSFFKPTTTRLKPFRSCLTTPSPTLSSCQRSTRASCATARCCAASSAARLKWCGAWAVCVGRMHATVRWAYHGAACRRMRVACAAHAGRMQAHAPACARMRQLQARESPPHTHPHTTATGA